MYEELTKRLRSTRSRSKRDLLMAAAVAIETQAEEIELLKKKLNAADRAAGVAHGKYLALQCELKDERYRHDRLQDYCVARDAQMDRIREALS